MSADSPVERLLRWRRDEAELEAPAPPRAADLLRRSRPWWERTPVEFQRQVERLFRAQPNLGYALAGGDRTPTGTAVPALRVRPEGDATSIVRVTYLNIRDERLRLRFVFADGAIAMDEVLAVTFVTNDSGSPLLEALAGKAGDEEYRLEADLPPALAEGWQRLRVTDAMPFRLILRGHAGGA